MRLRLLVPTDFSTPSLALVRSAVAWAQTLDGSLLLLHVVEGAPVRSYAVGRRPDAPFYWADLIASPRGRPLLPQLVHHDRCEQAQWKLSGLLPASEHDRFKRLVVVGKAVDEIVRVAREQHVDLIMMGRRSHRGLLGLGRRHVADQVARHLTIPVITV